MMRTRQSVRRTPLRVPFRACALILLATALACGGDGNTGPTTGALTVALSGLPVGVGANASITGPNGFTHTFIATETLGDLAPGDYVIASQPVVLSLTRYAPRVATQTVHVRASTTPESATVVYDIATGSLALSVSGAPSGASAAVSVTGPGGFTRQITASQTLEGLDPGPYIVTAASFQSGGSRYVPDVASQQVAVAASTTPATAAVRYVVGAGLDLTIDGLYITQAVQTYAGTVPLIAGRDGLLRVFVTADAPNGVRPTVRVRFYQGTTIVSTLTIPAPATSVPTAADESSLTSSWNAPVPAALLQPGLRVVADVDPDGQIAESDESDNAFPRSGTPAALDVRTVAPITIRFVPVTQSATGLTGGVTPQNVQRYLDFARRVLPIQTVNADVRSPYTTSLPALVANDSNHSWLALLSEMNVLRAADASTAYYFGVVKTSYGSGTAGYGYVPGHAAIGWDVLPSAASITAHEIGHNLSRQHAPCGGASNPDPNFPYAVGRIGVWGYDLATGTLKAPTVSDLMGYCGFTWISDYNFAGMLEYRQTATNPSLAPPVIGVGAASTSALQPSLLLWGRIDGQRLVLEPAFTVVTRPLLPTRAGPFRLEGLDGQGRSLFAFTFEGDEPADAPTPDMRHFAFAVPLSAAIESTLATLRLTANGRMVTLDSPLAASGGIAPTDPVASASIAGAGRVRVQWPDARLRMALVRDRRTGEILSLARGSSMPVRTSDADLEVVLSDGVRSVTRRVTAR